MKDCDGGANTIRTHFIIQYSIKILGTYDFK